VAMSASVSATPFALAPLDSLDSRRSKRASPRGAQTGSSRLAATSDGASRTRTGDLLGAIPTICRWLRRMPPASAVPHDPGYARCSQFGRPSVERPARTTSLKRSPRSCLGTPASHSLDVRVQMG
jgi:hypothetical protein